MAQSDTTARYAFFRSLAGVAMMAFPPMLLVNWAFDGNPLHFTLHPTTAAVVVGIVLTAFGSWRFRYRVSEDGIGGYTKYFQARSLRWSDIDRARITRPFPFRELVVTSSSGPTIRIPTCMTHRREFFGAILTHAPEESPVAEATRDLLSKMCRLTTRRV